MKLYIPGLLNEMFADCVCVAVAVDAGMYKNLQNHIICVPMDSYEFHWIPMDFYGFL
jgi:hypothetical protein